MFRFYLKELVIAAPLVLLVRFLYNRPINKTKQVHQYRHLGVPKQVHKEFKYTSSGE